LSTWIFRQSNLRRTITHRFRPPALDEIGFFFAVPFMVLGRVVAVWLALRFRDMSISTLVGGISLLIGADRTILQLG
jgi:hypothetical protein